ncbi:MAG: saccharopine dehydrogenase NADP-binding domain-containing protein [Anaerolineales bacterium]|nr:MAG: saccharopine dehydrogenase NADP-binding domain-containing protein [Anaerolineales bacterium]
MQVLLLGVGMQGKAALYDLAHSDGVTSVTAADLDLASLEAYVKSQKLGAKVNCEFVNANDRGSIDHLMARSPDVVVDLLPIRYIGNVAASALAHDVHYVNTYYVTEELEALAEQALEKNIALLPEFGLDPGIDLILLGEAKRHFDRIESVLSYGAGFPEPKAANNPLRYKVSWTFEGVLNAYMRPARLIQAGKLVAIDATNMFAPENVHHVEIETLGQLEAYPNGDALRYADMLKLDRDQIREMGRYALRWPGHCAFWKALVDLHLLDVEPVMVDGCEIDRRHFLAAVIEPNIQYQPDERDIALVRVEVTGQRNGRIEKAVYQMLDFRDLATGLTAMSRTVGFSASVGAQLIASGQLTKRGLLSPLTDIPYDLFVKELERRGVQISATQVGQF